MLPLVFVAVMVPVDMVSFASVENASSESFLSLKRVTKVSIPHNLSYHILTTRVSEANIDTEGEPRCCNNINLWCPPHQFCYRSVCVSIGALSARADGEYLFTFGGYSAQLTLLPVSGLP